MDSYERFYSDTLDPYAYGSKTRGAVWGVFEIGKDAAVERGLTQQDAEVRAAELNKAQGIARATREEA